jgi:hypothetical protein
MGLERRWLNDSARGFLIERLEASGSLGKGVASSRLPGGSLFTIADPEIPTEQLHAFHDAGVAPQSPIVRVGGSGIQRVQRPSEDAVRDLLFGWVVENPGTCVIAEEGLAEPSDRWLSKLAGSGVVVAPYAASEVFLVAMPGSDLRSTIATIMRYVNPFFGFIAVSRADPNLRWIELDAHDLEELSTAVRLVAVPAYDAEGYVIWEARGS